MPEAGSTKYITSLLKAMELLRAIAESENGMGVTEISRQLNYGVSATYHVLNTLKACGVVNQDKKSKKYRIGFTLFRIAEQARKQNLLGSLAMTYLDRLREELEETTNLSVLEGINVVCVAQSENTRMLRTFTRPGVGHPFYHTGGGKLLVSFQPRESWDALIAKLRFEKYTANTILNAGDLVRELEHTRARGWGLDNEEREDGVVCVAAPVFDSNGEVAAAMSISGPANRIKHRTDELAKKIMVVANDLSRAIGGHKAP